MRRLYEPPAYGPQGACFWADTVDPDAWPSLAADRDTDVAVIGGGFTGLNAALHLAQSGARVTLLDAEHPGWGASGRNGGFCCMGGAKASDATLRRRYGLDGAREWAHTQIHAVDHVAGLIDRHGWDVARHSEGETQLAHTPRAAAAQVEEAAAMRTHLGLDASTLPADALRQAGLGGPWHGALHVPVGFALNPRRYHAGLAAAARDAGAALFAHSAVTSIHRQRGRWRLDTPGGSVSADRVILATNGYTSEDLPPWIAGRTLPVQSHVIVTRPLTDAERAAQGWTSRQMAYDSRLLLHYFRLMPDNRFLFGMRGGLRATPRSAAALSRRIRADFARLFPAWRGVEITHEWSGLVCLMARLTPYTGPVPDHPGLFAALGYHGNGVAMGSYAGRLVADLALGRTPDGPYPAAMRDIPRRFPLGRYRRALLWPAYAAAQTLDL